MKKRIGPTAGLYIHVPFCKSLCLYCDFYSKVARQGEVDVFLDAFSVEASLRAESSYGDYHYDTVFIGGGTPSILTPPQITTLMRCLRDTFDISPKAEITIECNPSSLTKDLLKAYRDLGINRISLGVQSFDDRHLNRLGRLHSSRGACETVRLIHEARFDNLSLDLIFGIPGQTLFDWLEDLKTAVKLGPSHISAYNLIIEPETPFGKLQAKGKLKLPSEETQSIMYSALVKHLADAGFERYEISNFARPTAECRHNLKYWHLEPYLGLGPAAVSFDGKNRTKNEPDLPAYIKASKNLELPPADTEPLTDDKLREEMIMMGLRLTEGLPCDRLRERFGYDILTARGKAIESLQKRGYLLLENGHLKLTPESLFISDEIIVKLI